MKQPKIAIIDYGVGNITSISVALRRLDYVKVSFATSASQVLSADVLILPGVGAFDSCSSRIVRSGLAEALQTAAIERLKPTLGICVGMHLMAVSSTEHGRHSGFGWIRGRVNRIKPSGQLVVPHVGWNRVEASDQALPIANAFHDRTFYFNHGFAYGSDTPSSVATTDYGGPICAVVADGNLVGVQFHPEKSQLNGLRFFRGFVEWAARC